MIPFLKSIACAYASRYRDLSQICFLFPNKRSGTFFLKYLREECGRHIVISPEIMTISDLVTMLSGRVVASKLDLIFMLYECYRELRGLPSLKHLRELSPSNKDDEETVVQDFDAFRTWGETALSDFNEVDRYLADADAVFKNVKDYREISSNFLTEEQKEVMQEYFGHREAGSTEGFWKNFEDEDTLSDTKKKFLHLWRILSPLYDAMSQKLASEGLATPGGVYRFAAEMLKEKGRECLPCKKIVVVGFNALSASELAIFSELNGFEGSDGYDSFCDFFWDATGPVLRSGDNSASRFVKANIKMFPSPAWASDAVSRSDTMTLPSLRVVASPSNSAQTKIAGTLLSELRRRLKASEIEGAKVAVVLPDENLLLPMLYSLPDGMGNVNLTMGYPLRLTSVVPYVRMVRQLYRTRRAKEGEPLFFNRDLRMWLSHPFSHSTFGTGRIGKLTGYLDKYHKLTVTLGELREFIPEAAEMLDFGRMEKGVKPHEFLDSILRRVEESMPASGTGMIKSRLETDHIEVYRDALRRLGDMLEEYGIPPHPDIVFSLADRLLAGETVGFEGEPLTGLQVMGTLETRAIDFDHIFILSMNERIMPLRARTRSFIPDSLRHAFGMPPSNYSESIFAYYFYRMISRAKSVTMIYDARTGGGMRSGDVSRYVLQLKHLFAQGEMDEQNWRFVLSGKEKLDAGVIKSEYIRQRLKSYLIETGGKNLSASALKSYRECGVKFFFKYVMGLDPDSKSSEYIDAIQVGNILHSLMEQLYLPEKMRAKLLDNPVMMQASTIKNLIDDEASLWALTLRTVNARHFNKPQDQLDSPLTGTSEIVARQIMRMAQRVMAHDLRLAPFSIHGLEVDEKMRIPLPSGRIVNFKFAIDRLDEIMVDGYPTLRIVDYKTGKIKLTADSIDEVVRGDHRSEQAFQLFNYAWLLEKRGHPRAKEARLEIYDVPKIFKPDEQLPVIGGEKVGHYSEYSMEFDAGIGKMIDSIFDDPKFEASTDEGMCAFCGFRTLCRR